MTHTKLSKETIFPFGKFEEREMGRRRGQKREMSV